MSRARALWTPSSIFLLGLRRFSSIRSWHLKLFYQPWLLDSNFERHIESCDSQFAIFEIFDECSWSDKIFVGWPTFSAQRGKTACSGLLDMPRICVWKPVEQF